MDKIDQLAEWVRRTFWRRRDHVSESTGTQEAGLPVVLNSLGKLAISLFSPIVGNLTITGILTVTSDFITGSSTFLTGVYGAARAQIEKASNGTLLLTRTSNDTGGPTLEFLKRRTAWGVVNNGDRIGSIAFSAADGVDAAVVAQIAAMINGAPGSNDMPGRMVFSVTADGTQTLQDLLILNADKTVGIDCEPDYRLDVADRIRSRTGASGTGGMWVSDSSRNNRAFFGLEDDDATPIAGIWVNGVMVLRCTNTGIEVAGNLAVTGNFGPWTNLSYGSGWGDYSGSWQGGQYRKVGDLVQLRGLIARTSGTGILIATLPGGCHPPKQILNQVNGTDAHARIDIGSNGEIYLAVGTPTNISLNDVPPFSVI